MKRSIYLYNLSFCISQNTRLGWAGKLRSFLTRSDTIWWFNQNIFSLISLNLSIASFPRALHLFIDLPEPSSLIEMWLTHVNPVSVLPFCLSCHRLRFRHLQAACNCTRNYPKLYSIRIPKRLFLYIYFPLLLLSLWLPVQKALVWIDVEERANSFITQVCFFVFFFLFPLPSVATLPKGGQGWRPGFDFFLFPIPKSLSFLIFDLHFT